MLIYLSVLIVYVVLLVKVLTIRLEPLKFLIVCCVHIIEKENIYTIKTKSFAQPKNSYQFQVKNKLKKYILMPYIKLF